MNTDFIKHIEDNDPEFMQSIHHKAGIGTWVRDNVRDLARVDKPMIEIWGMAGLWQPGEWLPFQEKMLPMIRWLSDADAQKLMGVFAGTDPSDMFVVNHAIIRPDGTEIICEVRIEVHSRDETGVPIVISGVNIDATDLMALKESRRKAEEANHAKSEFLSRMSHELRTPMNAILGFTQLLEVDEENPLVDGQKEMLAFITSAGKHLLELINDILDLSTIESRELELSLEIVDIAPIIDNATSIFEALALASGKGISLDYQRNPVDSYFVEVDQLRLKQVILNLISNAIKYNKDNGSVVISYGKHNSGKMRIGVRDTGHGIPENKKDKLFKPFERFDKNAEKIEGTGIGLTITKQLVEMMNGTIGFESTVEEGSYFYIDLPISSKAPAIQVSEKPDVILPPTTKGEIKILYVEDTRVNVTLVKKILANARPNIKLISASNGQTGIEIAQAETPDLILMDIHMPDMDGLAAFKMLHTINEIKNIPVVALTARAMGADVKKAMDMGFKDYITKPIDIPTFLKKIDKVLT